MTAMSSDCSGNQKYRYVYEYLNDSIAEFRLYTVKNDFESDSLLFSSQLKYRYVMLQPYVCNQTIVLLSAGGNNLPYPDTSYIESYNLLSGQLINQRKMYGQFNLNTDFPLYLFNEPQNFLNHDTLFYVAGRHGDRRVAVLNLNTLNTERLGGVNQYVDSLFVVDYEIGLFDGREYYVDSSGVEVAGMLSELVIGQGWGSEQFGLCKIGWNDSIHYVKQYGDTATDESAWGYDRTDSLKYMVGSTPKTTNLWQTKTGILLYQLGTNGYDSLLIYGNKNHFAERVLSTSSGDVFIVSAYSNAWTDSSIYVVLTKIPASVLSNVRDQTVSRKLHLYPNPTNHYLRSDDFSAGDLIKIYGISGQLLREEHLTYAKRIDVSELNNGTYVLRLIKEKEEKAILFVVEQ